VKHLCYADERTSGSCVQGHGCRWPENYQKNCKIFEYIFIIYALTSASRLYNKCLCPKSAKDDDEKVKTWCSVKGMLQFSRSIKFLKS